MTRIASDSRSVPEDTLAQHFRWQRVPEPQREFVFHPTRKWRFDFAWPIYKVAVEVEGGLYPIKQPDGSFHVGRHGSGAAFEKDAEKYNEAAILGWVVIRVTTKMVDDGRAVAFTIRALNAVARSRAGLAAKAASG